MSRDRLRTDFWAAAQIRRLNGEGIPVVVVRKGDPGLGAVLVKINRLEHGCLILTQVWDGNGHLCWMAANEGIPVPETDADAYITRAVARDYDLWVLEIENRSERHVLEGRIL